MIFIMQIPKEQNTYRMWPAAVPIMAVQKSIPTHANLESRDKHMAVFLWDLKTFIKQIYCNPLLTIIDLDPYSDILLYIRSISTQ